jgi:hypothetical protein
MGQVIDERGQYRLVLVYDEGAGEPYHDGGTPLLRCSASWAGGLRDVEQVTNITSYRVSNRILEALQEIGEDREGFERYLRIFHGMRSIVWLSNKGAYDYVTFDTQDWRDVMGLTEEYLSEHPDVEGTGFANLDEYAAWLSGEVYGYRIERKQRWLPVNDENEVVSFLDTTEQVTWEEEDSCYGYYGYEVAEAAAREEFDLFLGEHVGGE